MDSDKIIQELNRLFRRAFAGVCGVPGQSSGDAGWGGIPFLKGNEKWIGIRGN